MLDYLKYGVLLLVAYYILIYIVYGAEVFSFKKKEAPKKIKKKKKKNDFIKIINKKDDNIKNITTLAKSNSTESNYRSPELNVKDIEIEISEMVEANEEIVKKQGGVEVDKLIDILHTQEKEVNDINEDGGIKEILDDLDIVPPEES